MKTYLLSFAILLFLIVPFSFGQEENSDKDTVACLDTAYFTVQQQGRDFVLNWATASENKDARLELQKSFNERQFETLIVVKGTDRQAFKAHTYIDKTPFERTAHEVKVIYYRLKQIEANQTYNYSKVLTIIRETEGEDYIDPKPVL